MNKNTKQLFPSGLTIFLLTGVGFLIYAAGIRTYGGYLVSSLQGGPIILQVNAIAQSRVTSCGEAVITMAYNYVHPESPIAEETVIEYASSKGYFTEDFEPFTSPANMVKITRHYTNDYSSGRVSTSDQGLVLLIQRLRSGIPVIIDVRTRLNDPEAAAHFVLVTGISDDSIDGNAITIYYNDPLTGNYESANWAGSEGLWSAWQNNRDPGGPGWWLAIH